jgi:hypothetical protein
MYNTPSLQDRLQFFALARVRTAGKRKKKRANAPANQYANFDIRLLCYPAAVSPPPEGKVADTLFDIENGVPCASSSQLNLLIMFKNLNVHVNDGFLSIQDGNNRKIWSIAIAHMKQLRNGHQSNTIEHLSEKSWATPELLYQVAEVIHQHHPDSSIDWELSFFPVEKQDYLEKLHALKGEIEQPDREKGTNRFMERIKLGMEENNPENNEAIKALVRDRLTSHHLL